MAIADSHLFFNCTPNQQQRQHELFSLVSQLRAPRSRRPESGLCRLVVDSRLQWAVAPIDGAPPWLYLPEAGAARPPTRRSTVYRIQAQDPECSGMSKSINYGYRVVRKTFNMSKPTAISIEDPRWAQVVARAPQADGQFVYAVKTTGVFCRPSCGSRTPNPENVSFFTNNQEAQAAGYRPCKRCTPDQPSLASQHAELVAGLCRQIEAAPEPLSLETLARSARMSTFHLHRVFKAVTGLTPKAYSSALRARKVRDELSQGGSITEAIYQAGYNANSRFYAESNQRLGMTPQNFRGGGRNTEIRFAVGECSLGPILVAASQRGICAILFGDNPDALTRDLQDRFPQAELIGADAEFEHWVAQVVGLVEMPQLGLALPLDVRGTAFQQRVWQALQEIPIGSTASYSEIALRIGAPKAVRAVAGACAANPLAVAVPCHRVVRTDGGLAGYRWGVERKRALLEREAEACAPTEPSPELKRDKST